MEHSAGTVEEALDLAKRGMAYEACERLWPLVRDPDTRDEAVFTLAYCFERANNLPTAAYLYNWIAGRHPEFNVAARRAATCKAQLDARGLHEDFADSGHVDCPCGLFRYRAELGLCPYCGRPPGVEADAPEADADTEAAAPTDTGSRSEDVFQRVRQDLERAWKSIQGKFDEFTQRDDLKGPAQHAQVLAKELSERAKKLTASDTGKDLRGAADRDDLREARTRLEEWTRQAADRIEDFARSDRVQSAGRTAYSVLERVVARLQAYIDQVKGTKTDDSTGDGDRDRKRDDLD